jgi:hypothetical protein
MFQLLVEIYMIGLCCQNFDIIKKKYIQCEQDFFSKKSPLILNYAIWTHHYLPTICSQLLMPLSILAIFETHVLWVI